MALYLTKGMQKDIWVVTTWKIDINSLFLCSLHGPLLLLFDNHRDLTKENEKFITLAFKKF